MWKKTTVMVALLVLVLGSCFAWPTNTVNPEAAVEAVAVVENVQVEQNSEKASLKQAEDYQQAVSVVRELLSKGKLSKSQAKELAEILDDFEVGIGAMTSAYKELAGFHMGIVPSVGYTIGQPLADGFDVGVNLVANYKNWYATLGANKGINLKDVKDTFTKVDGLRASLGFGFQLF